MIVCVFIAFGAGWFGMESEPLIWEDEVHEVVELHSPTVEVSPFRMFNIY